MASFSGEFTTINQNCVPQFRLEGFPENEQEGVPFARSLDNVLLTRSEDRHVVQKPMNTGGEHACSVNLPRRPYLFVQPQSDSNASLLSSPIPVENRRDVMNRDHNMAIRYRFFNRLDPGGLHLLMPIHVIPTSIFSVLPFNEFKDSNGKQSSMVTIFSIWNTMVGTSLLAVPWALQQAGLVLGIFLMLLMAGIAFYTAYRIIEKSLQQNSTILPIGFNQTCDVYCPKQIENAFPNDFLSLSPSYIFSKMSFGENESNFQKIWRLQGGVPLILAFCIFPLLNFRSPGFFMRFNGLGTISVVYLICFTLIKSAECGLNLDFTNHLSKNYIQLFNWKFPALTGTLALAYFIHNAILTILRNQKHPENNARDLLIGYFLSAGCYIIISLFFFTTFPTYRNCISDNFLNNFASGDMLSAIARVFLLFQMLTVLPLLMYLIRVQFSYVFAGTVYPGLFYVLLINGGILTIALFFAVVYPHVGPIIRYVGSICGLVYMFILPCAVHLKRLQIQGRLNNVQIAIHCVIIICNKVVKVI
uniref:Amino acid transporter transmembrane domain-containing protein n=1 Tax=Meloidogyne floridensis TaxID=298350 RepID=A0A915P5Y4_9BILA